MSTASVRPGKLASSDADKPDRQSDQQPAGDNGSTERDKGDRLIGEHLEAVRAALWRSVFLKNILILAAAIFTACLTFIVVDQWIYSFNTTLRFIWLIALVGFACWWTVSRLVPLIRLRVSPEYAAYSIEHDEPELQHSLTSYVTLRDDRDAPGLRGIVVRSIGARAAKHLTTSGMSMPTETLGNFRTGMFTAAAFAALILYAVLSPKNTVQTISRLAAPLASITPPSRVSILEVTPGDVESLYGRPLDVTARISGLAQSEIPTIVLSGPVGPTGDNSRAIELAPTNQSDNFSVSLPASLIQDNFQYQVRAGDARSAWFDVTVRDEPTVTIAEVQYVPHPYTGLPPRTSSVGAIDGLEGTRVTVVGRTNRKIVRGRIEFNPRQVGGQTSATGGFAALDISEDGQTVSATWNLRTGNRSGGQVEIDSYRLRVWDESETQNPDPIEFPIRVSADLAPEIRITVPSTWPKDVPLGTEQLVEIRAADPDFGLTKVEVRVRRGTRLLTTIPILQPKALQPANAQQPTALRGPQILEYRFQPDKLGLMSGDLVTIEAVAYDNRTNIEGTQPDPNITVSDPIELNVVDRPAPNEVVEDGDGLQQPTPQNDQQQQDKQDQAGDDSQPSEDGQDGDSQSGDKKQSGENSGDQSDENQEQSGEGDQPQDQQDAQQQEQQQGGGGASEEQDAQKGEGQGSGQSGGSSDQNNQQPNDQQNNQSQGGGSGTSPDNASNQDSPSSQSGQSSNENSESNANNDPASENSDPNSPTKQGQGAAQGSPSNEQSSQPPAENGANQPQNGPRSPASNDGEAMERIRDYLNQKQSENANKERKQDDSLEGGAESPNQDGPQPNPEEQTKQDKSDRPQNASGQGTGKKDPNQDPNNQKSNNQSTGNTEPKDRNKNQNQSQDNQQNQGGAGDDSQQPPQTQTDSTNNSQDGKLSTTNNPNDKKTGKPSDAKPADTTAGKPADKPDAGQSDNDPSTDKTGNPSSENSSAQQQPQDQSSNNSDSDASSNASPSKNQTPPDNQQSSNKQPSSDAQNGSQNGSQNQSSNTDPSDANNPSNPASNDQENPNPNNSESNDPNNPKSGSQQTGKQSTAKPPQDPSQTEPSEPTRGNAIGNNTSGEAMPDGFQGDAASTPQAPDPVDVEAAKKATDLVLDSLKNQRENPDQELLDRLGWTDDQLRRFVDRWEKTRKLGEQNDPAAQKQYEDALKSLGIRPPGSSTPRRSTGRDDQLQQLQDTGSRMAAPAKFREAIEAYRRSLKNND